jgi:cell division protein ZapA
MAQNEGATSVNVTIAGRSFRMACGPGEEAHLEALASQIDERINQLRGAFGEIGDQRLTVMASITLADELAEARKKIAALEKQVSTARNDAAKAGDQSAAWVESLAQSLEVTARRIEGLAQTLNGTK